MNQIPRQMLLLTVVLATVLTGCAATAANASGKDGARHPAEEAAARVAAVVADVRDGWAGADIPDQQWIAGQALLFCKHAPDGLPATADANRQLITDAALEHLCPEIAP